MVKYVKVKCRVPDTEAHDVECPFCHEITHIPADDTEPVITGCEHLQREDYMSADHDGFSVWFQCRDSVRE